MLQARTIYLIVIAVGSAFLAGFGTAAVMFRPVMEGWRRKYYHEKRTRESSLWFFGEVIKALRETSGKPATGEKGKAHEQPTVVA